VVESCKNLLNVSTDSAKSSHKPKKLKLVFTCPSAHFAKHLWRHILAQQAFYTAESAKSVKPVFSRPHIPIFMRGSTFRCPVNRVQHEIKNSPVRPDLPLPNEFERYALRRQTPRSQIEPWSGNASSFDESTQNVNHVTTPTSENAVGTPVTENATEQEFATTSPTETQLSAAENRRQAFQRGARVAPILSDSSEEVRANAASNKRNGSAKSNGLLLSSEKASSSTLPSQILYWSLVLAAFAIIIGVLMIFVFETMDHSRWLRSGAFPTLDYFKQHYYNPLKLQIGGR